jgi:hypothetical protein
MRISNVWIDGGSFFLGLFFLGGAVGPLVSGVKVTYWFAETFVFLALVFFWLSFKIGAQRKISRGPARWMEDKQSDASNN